MDLRTKLAADGSINYRDIYQIMEAFDIASGQGFATENTKILLDFLNDGYSFIIQNFKDSTNYKKISTKMELAAIFKEINQFIDISKDKVFEVYFSF